MARRLEHVIVIGAGIGGLTAALLLSKIVERVTVVEQVERPGEVGAGIALQHNGMAVLELLGLLPAVAARAQPTSQMTIYGARGRMIIKGAMPDLGGGLDHGLAVPRRHLHAVLVDAVQRESRIETRFGWRVVSADTAGEITAQQGDETQTLSADLVVGADGVGSAVRTAVGIEARISTGASYLRALVPGSSPTQLEEHWTTLGAFGQASLGEGLTYLFAAAHRPEVAEPLARRDLAAVTAVWGEAVPAAGDLLGRVASFDDLLLNSVRRVDCPRWWSGRVVLLGDAAHAMAPNLGQGANSAMVDGAVLCEALLTAPSTTEALRRYDRRRRPTTRRIQNTAALLERWCELRDPRRVWLRDTAVRSVGRMPFLMASVLRRSLGPDVRAVRAAGDHFQRAGSARLR